MIELNAEQFTALCKSKGACREGLEWIRGKSLAEFWQTTDRADWMLWLAGKMAGRESSGNTNAGSYTNTDAGSGSDTSYIKFLISNF